MRILITGGGGYLGSSLLRYIHEKRPGYALYATYHSLLPRLDFPALFQVDLLDSSAVERLVEISHPQLIIHTAARMRGAFEELYRVNAEASRSLANVASKLGSRIIYISTDMVFDGRRGAYTEVDVPSPLTDYGKSKLDGESAITESGSETVIVRTSLIYGFSPLDPRTRAVIDGSMVRLFTDERRSPIWVNTLCAAILELGEVRFTGTLHVAGCQTLSRFDFGTKLVRAVGGDSTRLISARSVDSGQVRPLDCSLDCSLAKRILKTELLGVDQVLDLGIY